MEPQLAKGVKDYPPAEMIVRQEITEKLKTVFERYGYNPMQTPILERYETLAVKFGAGDQSDAMKEIFRLHDQGDRELGLRFELTLSLCRYIAMNPHLKMPFKRYEIGRVYRDGPIKLGRLREFTQCDVDIVGTTSMMSDAEIILLGLRAIQELGLNAYIEINNRKLLKGILEHAGITRDQDAAIITIDKLKKIGEDGVAQELQEQGISSDTIQKVLTILRINGTKDSLEELKHQLDNDIGQQGIKELEEVFSYINGENVILNITLARGLSYYTGTIFEGFLKDSKITSSICGGGRYDDMIGMMLQQGKKVPGIGISFGLVPIMQAHQDQTKESVTKIYVIPIGKVQKEALQITEELRKQHNCDIDLNKRGISKNLNYVNAYNIPYTVFIGEEELQKGIVKIKDMESGQEYDVKKDKLSEWFQ
ncbi:MAG: histidine--tRNA ligase [Nanobdellota archaeon]